MSELITERIITCWNETGAPLHSDREMYGDPLQAYKQSGGAWTDTDADRIPDIVEIYFSNTTNIDNSRMWTHYTTNSNTASLFERYTWCRDYYHELNKTNSSAAENWTQKAFNPFVSYNLPPTIVGYDVHFTKRHSGWTVTVKIDFSYTVRDASGIREIKITIKDKFSSTVLWWSIERFPAAPTEHAGHDSCTVDYSGFGYIFIIEVSNGMNEVTTEHVFNELLGEVVDEVVDALAALGEMLVGGLQKAWEAVQNAVNAIVEWIKEKVKELVDPLIQPIISAITGWINSIDFRDATTILSGIFSDPIYTLAMALAVLIQTIVAIAGMFVRLSGFAGLAEGIASIALSQLVGEIAGFLATVVKGIAIRTLLTVGLSSAILLLLSQIISIQHPFFTTEIGIAIMGFAGSLNTYLINKWAGFPDTDARGLVVSLLGIFLAIGIVYIDEKEHTIPYLREGLSVLAVILAIAGVYYAFTTHDFLDRAIGGLIAYLEEGITVMILLYAIANILLK